MKTIVLSKAGCYTSVVQTGTNLQHTHSYMVFLKTGKVNLQEVSHTFKNGLCVANVMYLTLWEILLKKVCLLRSNTRLTV